MCGPQSVSARQKGSQPIPPGTANNVASLRRASPCESVNGRGKVLTSRITGQMGPSTPQLPLSNFSAWDRGLQPGESAQLAPRGKKVT